MNTALDLTLQMEAGRKMSSKHYSLKDAVPNQKNDFLILTLLQKKKVHCNYVNYSFLENFLPKIETLGPQTTLCVCVCVCVCVWHDVYK